MKKGLVSIFVVIAIWYIVTALSLVPPLYLPRPMEVVQSYRAQVGIGLASTLGRTVGGFTAGVALAYFLHLTAVSTRLINVMDAQFAASRTVPVIALIPLFAMWFGFSEFGRLLVVALSAMLYYLAPLQGAYRLLPREWTILRDQVPLSATAYYVQVVIPGTLGNMLGAIRLTFAIAFTMAIASEYIGARYGLGKVIDSARVTFNVPGIFLAIIIALIVGFSFDQIIVRTFSWLVHWAGAEGKK